MKKILIVEDETNLRKIMRYDIVHAGYECSEVDDGQKAIDMVSNNHFDLILLDWMIPSLSGIEVVEKLKQLNYQGSIIMITAKAEEADLLQAFEAGVDDYLTKPFSPRELLARVKAHLRKVNVKASEGLDIANLNINTSTRCVYIDKEEVVLTKKEYELLYLLATNQNKVLSRDVILNEVWGFEYDNDTRIVDVHIFKLRTKLKEANLNFKANRGVGYMLEVKNDH